MGSETYDIDGALVLYQALTGDGNDALVVVGSVRASDGKIDDEEVKNIKLQDMPRDMWKKTADGYILVDGYGHPFQYASYNATAVDETVNSTYDLWSFGGAAPVKPTKATKQDLKQSARWIKNW